MARWSKELSGSVFGRWTVLEKGPPIGKSASWKCKCECGTERLVAQFSLLKGVSTSCGCFFKENISKLRTKHSMCGTSEYNSWASMIARCTNEQNPNYKIYGARGITVCDRWLKFDDFIADMGNKPSPNHSIERIDVNGHYEPGNCKWADDYEQARNKRMRSTNTSGHTGVHWDKFSRKWRVQINSETGKHYLGQFEDLDDAVHARKLGEQEYWGVHHDTY